MTEFLSSHVVGAVLLLIISVPRNQEVSKDCIPWLSRGCNCTAPQPCFPEAGSLKRPLSWAATWTLFPAKGGQGLCGLLQQFSKIRDPAPLVRASKKLAGDSPAFLRPHSTRCWAAVLVLCQLQRPEDEWNSFSLHPATSAPKIHAPKILCMPCTHCWPGRCVCKGHGDPHPHPQATAAQRLMSLKVALSTRCMMPVNTWGTLSALHDAGEHLGHSQRAA